MTDVYIKLSELETAKANLDTIVEEFEQAVDRSEDLEREIGRPFGRGELKSAVEDFETRWDVSRNTLKDDLSEIRDHLQGVIEGVSQADADMAIALEPKE